MSTPNFFLVGVTKAGTSSLHSWLSGHPDIYLPAEKELHFYCECPARLKSITSPSAYEQVFRSAPPGARVIGEASPCYSYYPSVAERLAQDWPEARILVSLRDPVDRFWSHHLMNSWYHSEHPDAELLLTQWTRGESPATAVEDVVGSGMYHDQLRRLFDSFGSERVMVTTLEELSSNPEAALSKTFAYLELNDVQIDVTVREKAYAQPRNRLSEAILTQPRLRQWAARRVPTNIRRVVKYRLLGDVSQRPEPSSELVDRLTAVYEEDVQATADLLGRSLPWPHFPSTMSR